MRFQDFKNIFGKKKFFGVMDIFVARLVMLQLKQLRGILSNKAKKRQFIPPTPSVISGFSCRIFIN